ncbi:hypothetical protein D3C78_1566390 [compost metagenome]
MVDGADRGFVAHAGAAAAAHRRVDEEVLAVGGGGHLAHLVGRHGLGVAAHDPALAEVADRVVAVRRGDLFAGGGGGALVFATEQVGQDQQAQDQGNQQPEPVHSLLLLLVQGMHVLLVQAVHVGFRPAVEAIVVVRHIFLPPHAAAPAALPGE